MVASFSQRPVDELTNHHFLVVYNLAQGNLEWQLFLLSSILGTTSKMLITLSFVFRYVVLWFAFLRKV